MNILNLFWNSLGDKYISFIREQEYQEIFIKARYIYRVISNLTNNFARHITKSVLSTYFINRHSLSW